MIFNFIVDLIFSGGTAELNGSLLGLIALLFLISFFLVVISIQIGLKVSDAFDEKGFLNPSKNESTLLINFEVNSKEDAKAIIELFNLAVKLFFSKNNEVYFSSDNYLSKMVKSIGETKWIPDDYDLGIGIPKSRLSMFVLRQRFAN